MALPFLPCVCYLLVMALKTIKEVIERAETWPKEDQDELLEYAREIEARRTGVYVMTGEERVAIERARRSVLVKEEDVQAFWKRHRIP
jgi:hypothetical protein